MRNIFSRLIIILTLSLFLIGFLPSNKAIASDVNDFSFSSFEADYYLSKDNEGRATMKVVEKLTAEFVNQDQNKGIERAIPKYYDGHALSFNLESLTRNGQTEPVYEQRNESNFVVVATGTEEYVNGTQQYVFTYTLRDVVKTFGNHQELYWDTNGTGWSQQFGKLNVRVHLDDSVKSAFTGEVWCYEGIEGSNKSCISETKDNVVNFSSNGLLNAYENVTINLSFKANTFSAYKMSITDFIPFIFSGIALLLLTGAIFIKIRFGRNHPGRGTIVPEYLPPKNVSIQVAAEIGGKSITVMTAQIIDLAVRHRIKIIESEQKIWLMKSIKYTLELVNIDGLSSEEMDFIIIIFSSTRIGSTYTFERSDSTKARRMLELNKSVKKQTENIGLRLKQPKQELFLRILSIIIFLILAITIFISVDNPDSSRVIISIVVTVMAVTLASMFNLFSLKPLTDKGRELFDYLKGLEMYIKLAEADRIKVLQSPQGADKKPIDTNDGSKMVVLYERVLPYAVLFGQEKEWLKHLGTYYEANQTSPGWYSGVHAFNVANFASSVSSFSSYSNSSSFSSSSGSGGGGSSGGGGGGGGGGGR